MDRCATVRDANVMSVWNAISGYKRVSSKPLARRTLRVMPV